jgi:hypothetical protein
MNRKWAVGAMAVLVLTLAVGGSAFGQETSAPRAEKTELAVVAIDRAAKAGKYMFVFFYRAENGPTQAARKTFDAAMEKFADRAASAVVDVADPLEAEVVAKYGLGRSPTPLVLALAPNGAVTRSFMGQLADADFESAFVSPGSQKSLKALQDRKLVFICVQNGTTQHNTEAMRGVQEFVGDAQYAKTTELITLDPTDAAEASFLGQLKVDPQTAEAVTVFMAPPGTTVATYKGETKKDVLIAAAKTAAKGCDPKSGCCPAPKKPADASAQPKTDATEKKP